MAVIGKCGRETTSYTEEQEKRATDGRREPEQQGLPAQVDRQGHPYVHPETHDMEFPLDVAMKIAEYEPVTVYDAETGRGLWAGGTPTQGLQMTDGRAEIRFVKRTRLEGQE